MSETALPLAMAPKPRRWVTLVQQQGALVALVIAFVFGAARYVAFPTPENLLNVLRQNSMVGLLALGMTFVILTGGVDLSVGSLLAVAGVAAASLSANGTTSAALVGIALAALLGLVNGLLIAKARLQPFVVTLAMMIAAQMASAAAIATIPPPGISCPLAGSTNSPAIKAPVPAT